MPQAPLERGLAGIGVIDDGRDGVPDRGVDETIDSFGRAAGRRAAPFG